MADEARKELNDCNVDVFTFHGLAYRYVGKMYRNKLTTSYTYMSLKGDLELGNESPDYIIGLHWVWNKFLLSHKNNLVEFIKELDFLFASKKKVFDHIYKLFQMKKDLRNDCEITHDFYLKLFSIMNIDMVTKGYDILATDEIQDLTGSILGTWQNFSKKKIAVGDPHQNINGWRDTVNLFDYMEEDSQFLTLSNSFRVSQPLADICNKIYKDVTGNSINMKGLNPNNRIVQSIDENEKHVIISRTRSELFEDAYKYANNGFNIAFEGKFGSYGFTDYLDVHFFRCGADTRNPFLKNFNNYGEFQQYVKDHDLKEWNTIIQVVNSHSKRGEPSVVDMYRVIKDSVVSRKSDSDVLLTTVHRSKGQDYTVPVIVKDNMLNIQEVLNVLNSVDLKERERILAEILEELNILYVAITRAKGEIVLPESLYRYIYGRRVLR